MRCFSRVGWTFKTTGSSWKLSPGAIYTNRGPWTIGFLLGIPENPKYGESWMSILQQIGNMSLDSDFLSSAFALIPADLLQRKCTGSFAHARTVEYSLSREDLKLDCPLLASHRRIIRDMCGSISSARIPAKN